MRVSERRYICVGRQGVAPHLARRVHTFGLQHTLFVPSARSHTLSLTRKSRAGRLRRSLLQKSRVWDTVVVSFPPEEITTTHRSVVGDKTDVCYATVQQVPFIVQYL